MNKLDNNLVPSQAVIELVITFEANYLNEGRHVAFQWKDFALQYA
jgi:hypothetical protein